jgi:hypothetical protein
MTSLENKPACRPGRQNRPLGCGWWCTLFLAPRCFFILYTDTHELIRLCCINRCAERRPIETRFLQQNFSHSLRFILSVLLRAISNYAHERICRFQRLRFIYIQFAFFSAVKFRFLKEHYSRNVPLPFSDANWYFPEKCRTLLARVIKIGKLISILPANQAWLVWHDINMSFIDDRESLICEEHWILSFSLRLILTSLHTCGSLSFASAVSWPQLWYS